MISTVRPPHRPMPPILPLLALSLLAGALFVTACGAPDAGSVTPGAAVVDSAGVAIVTNGSPDALPLHDLRGTQVLDLGRVDGPEEFLFSGVGAAELLDDGRLVVADRSGTLRYYDAAGAYLGSFGGLGEGPGEFSNAIMGLWQRSADTLVAFDARRWRLSVVADGGLVAVFSVIPPKANRDPGRGLLADGSVVFAERVFDIQPSGFSPIHHIVQCAPLAEAPADTVFTADGARFGRITEMASGATFVGSPVFEPDYVVTAAADRILASSCHEPELRQLAPDGTLERIVRWDEPDRRVAPADVDAYWEARIARIDDEDYREMQEQRRDAVPANEQFPACDDLHAVDGHTTWIERFPRPGAPNDWLILEDGELRSRVRLPAGSRLLAATGRRVATVERDELDVEHVRVYELPIVKP
ncbi:MAG: hypothetical protein PVF05_06570 [Gemmatimonadales bacterium]|jgi:hypothetical protein